VLGAALAAIVIGIIFLFVIPWVGLVAGVVSLILLVVYFVGATRRPIQR
jgi:hypothetical protein